MIKKSILAALVMLVAYHFLFPHIPRTYFQLSGAQRDNFFRAQRYLYEKPPNEKVILGSSLSLRLNGQTLGPDYFKLTFGGASVFNGLEIVRRANKHPAVVLIEINQVAWDEDKALLHDLFEPWRMKLRYYAPIFREEGRPANFVNGIGEALVHAACQWGSRLLGHAPPPELSPGSGALNPALLSRLMRLHHDETLAVAPPNLAGRANRLGDYVEPLIRDGSICVFYEMPIDASLTNLPLPVAVRKAMEARFPKDKYHWLNFPRDHDYDTYDGLHLSQAEADRLTETMVAQLNQISH